MAALYSDEDVRLQLVKILRSLGHDVVTAADDGRAGQRIPDPDVLARATMLDRAVVTKNRWDYHRLHRVSTAHAGITTFTHDPDDNALAERIHAAIQPLPSLAGQLIRIIRPWTP